jgi:hypothetical protein
VSNIRHIAVHRLSTPAREIGRLLDSAAKFTEVLRIDEHLIRLHEIHQVMALFDYYRDANVKDHHKSAFDSCARGSSPNHGSNT